MTRGLILSETTPFCKFWTSLLKGKRQSNWSNHVAGGATEVITTAMVCSVTQDSSEKPTRMTTDEVVKTWMRT